MKDDCLLETVVEGCDPPVPEVKGLAFGRNAIWRETNTTRWWRRGSNDSLENAGFHIRGVIP